MQKNGISEDWLAVCVGFVMIALVLVGLTLALPAFKWAMASGLGKVLTGTNIQNSVILGAVLLFFAALASLFQRIPFWKFIASFPVVFALAWLAQLVAGNATISRYGIEYVLWALLAGLIISNIFGVPAWLKPAVKTELYIKTGVVLLGAGILWAEITKAGALGILQALIVVSSVWYVCWWLARKFGVDEKLAAVLASGVSICGVSAAIATGGAVKADAKHVSYVTSLVLLVALPMLVFEPMIARWLGMAPTVAGAWIGGTLDTSGSVVAAGELVGPVAMKTGVIVKLSQNVLIGLVAFLLALWFTMRRKTEADEKPSATEIWTRFPKFVLGFILASFVFSFLVDPKTLAATKSLITGLRTWWFALAFVCIGLETRLGEFFKLGGGRPAAAFLLAQGFNIVLTLVLAYLLFGGILFAVPNITA